MIILYAASGIDIGSNRNQSCDGHSWGFVPRDGMELVIGENPAKASDRDRYLFEVAFEQYVERHKVYTLCKIEDPNWTVFHTNTHEERLQKTREKYLKRQGIEPFINAGFSDGERIPAQALYYGQPQMGIVKKLRIMFGESLLGPYWRWLKQRLAL